MSQEPAPLPSEPTAKSSPEPTSKSKASKPNNSTQRSRPQVLLGMLRQLGGILLAFIPLLWQIGLKLFNWISRQWGLLLPKLRPVLPAALRNLPDTLITAIAIALLLLLLWIPTTLLGHRPAAAQQPVPIEAPVDAPGKPPITPPRPDRNAARLVKLQTQISDAVTQQAEPYGADLVQKVRADFTRKQLSVSLADRWYSLTSAQRHQIADLLLKQAKKQGFAQVELTDLKGTTLARPAVVGSGMVILAEA